MKLFRGAGGEMEGVLGGVVRGGEVEFLGESQARGRGGWKAQFGGVLERIAGSIRREGLCWGCGLSLMGVAGWNLLDPAEHGGK